MQLYESPPRGDGIHYTLKLPDDWTTQKEDDGERWFITHRSPTGSRLKLTVTRGASTTGRPNGMPSGLTDPTLRMAYTLAEYDGCVRPARTMPRYFFRSLIHAFGWHVELEDETLGLTRGFSYKIGSRGKGWYGWFVQSPCMIRVDFQPAGQKPNDECSTARDIVATMIITDVRVAPLVTGV